MIREERNKHIRRAVATIPGDASNDAIGSRAPKLSDMFAPEAHAAALDPGSPIVVGARGAGKSFWSGVLGNNETKAAAASAYPRLKLDQVVVEFGYTGVPGSRGLSKDAITQYKADASPESARTFWWATILRAADFHFARKRSFGDLTVIAADWESRGEELQSIDEKLKDERKTLLIVYDALDTIAIEWPARQILTEALLDVVWQTRGFVRICPKLFLRPDQINDNSLRFVELPKLRAGAIKLVWDATDLYGLFFARLALTGDTEASVAFSLMLNELALSIPSRADVLERRWKPSFNEEQQRSLMEKVAGPFMAAGAYGYKKGKTYDWPLAHLADAFREVTPRSFLGLMIGAAQMPHQSLQTVITPEGIRHGLRGASQTRVDQLHQEFPWIKGVLAPLDGLLLPQPAKAVIEVWRAANTLKLLSADAEKNGYLSPVRRDSNVPEDALLSAMEEIGVMFRRRDGRVDMPDLYRVAARLLKKGGTAPL
jgi:hypothetical protein